MLAWTITITTASSSDRLTFSRSRVYSTSTTRAALTRAALVKLSSDMTRPAQGSIESWSMDHQVTGAKDDQHGFPGAQVRDDEFVEIDRARS